MAPERGRADAALPTVSVVVPAHRAGPALDTCLAALAALDPEPHEVVVAVDGADAEVVARAVVAGAATVALPTPSGPAAARNRGAELATGAVLWFVDSDVAVPADAVARIGALFAGRPDVAAAVGSYDLTPPERNFTSQYKNLLNHWVHQGAGTEATTFWGACGAIRRETFAAVGGFDEGFARASIEDIELGYRLREAGHRVVMAPDLQVTHLKHWTPWTLVASDVRDRALPWATLILRRGGLDDELNVDVRGRARVAVSGLGLVAAAASPRFRPARSVLAASLGALLVLDAPLLRFYARVRGPGFALRSLGWTWLSHVYSGLSLVAAALLHVTGRHDLAGLPPERRGTH